MKTPSVKVLEVRTITTLGNLKAFVSIQIGPLVIHDFRVIQQEGQRAYVSAPQAEYLTKEGQKRFKPLLSYPEQWKDAIQSAVLAAWQEEKAAREANHARLCPKEAPTILAR